MIYWIPQKWYQEDNGVIVYAQHTYLEIFNIKKGCIMQQLISVAQYLESVLILTGR